MTAIHAVCMPALSARAVPAQITFLLARTTRVNQPQFWNIDPNGDGLGQFKTQNYQGTYADLNIFTTMLQNSVLGCGHGPC